jgi:hypothetical protein
MKFNTCSADGDRWSMKRMRELIAVLSLSLALAACTSWGGALHLASGQGDLKAMNDALHSGANPNKHEGNFSNVIDGWSPAGWGGPPLHHAAFYCRGDAARLLLEKGADVNAKGGYELTALHRSAFKDCVDVTKILLESGADLDARDTLFQMAPLEWAAAAGSARAVKLLVEKGADPEEAILTLQAKTDKNFGAKLNPATGVQLLSAVARRNKQVGQPAAPHDRLGDARREVRSDIDELPAMRMKQNKNAYAIVIGIEQYRQKLPRADFATQDAKTVADYLTKALGYPEENVITLTNDHASNVDLVKYFEKWLPNNAETGSTVFVYYSGHGAPNPKTGDAYLVPFDGDPSFIDETGYSLKRMYTALGKIPAKEVIVALDSCFSGSGGRSVLAKGARPLVMNLKTDAVTSNTMSVLAASSGAQISSTYDEKGHGLFTYFLLKGIKNEDVVKQDGTLDVASLYDYLKPQVESIARKKYNNEQTPQLIGQKK